MTEEQPPQDFAAPPPLVREAKSGGVPEHVVEDVQTDSSAVRGWLSALHGSSPGYITVNWAPIGGGWRYEWFDTSDGGLEAAADCASSATGVGIYVSTCSYAQPSPSGRGRAPDTLALPGLWADLDLAGPGHAAPGNGLGLLPDLEAARRVVAHLPPPTLWVHSGGGLYPWWLLHEPQLLDEGTRSDVGDLSRRWHQSISAVAADLGWHVGDTGDLARVLRVPGTINRKEGLARACRLLEQRGPRYDLSELAVVVEDAPTRRPALAVESVGLTQHVADRKGSGPFDVLEDMAQWSDVLPRDWTLVRTEADGVQLWKRPGDPSSDYSARAELGGKHLITVFSDVAGLPVGQPLSMGQLFAALHHHGDCSEAARDLLRAANAHPGASSAARSLPQVVLHAIAQRFHLTGWDHEPMPEPDFFGSVPIPLTDRRQRPSFPLEALPRGVTEMVAAVAEFTQTDPGMAGTCAISMLAAAAGGRVELEARPGWHEPLNLYTATVASPGERKSAVQNEMAAPLRAVEKELVQAGEAARTEAEILRDVALEAAKKAQKAAGHARGQQRDDETAEAVAAQMHAQAITVPPMPRLIADDATSEAVASLLVEQNGRLTVMSSEGGIFDVIGGRYSPNNAPNLDVWLKGHAGDPLRVDRKGRPAEHIDRPALTVALMIQPAVLTAIARNDAMRGRGLLARFLYALPGSRVGSRSIRSAPVPHAVRSAYRAVIQTLTLNLTPLPQPVVIRFEEAAQERMLTYADEVEAQLAPAGDLGHIADWGSKLLGATVRLAGLLHLGDHPSDGWQRPVGLSAVERAILLADYYQAHALEAFDQMRTDPTVADAEYLLDVLRRLGLSEISKRDLHVKSSRSRFGKVNELDPPLALLEAHGYLLRRPQPPRPGPGRPPSPTWSVHPSLLTEATKATQSAKDAGSAA